LLGEKCPPAGTSGREHYRLKGGSEDVWVSKDVKPYGLVKSQTKDSTMTLTKVLTDAKDKINGDAAEVWMEWG
jgi:hypothetical protein